MPDSDNGNPAPKKPGDTSMEQRLLLAFILMGAVLFATQYFYKPQPETIKQVPPKPEQQAVKPAPPPPPSGEPAASQVVAGEEQQYTIETDLYKIVLSNRGAVLESWILKKYRDAAGKPLELVNPVAAPKVPNPLTLVFKDQKPSADLNQALFVAELAGDGLGIDFEFSDGNTTARKSLRFLQNSYLSQVTTEVLEKEAGVPHFIAWRGGFGDPAVPGAASLQRAVYYNPAEDELIENDADAASDGPVSASGPFSFAGVEDAFFAAVFLPKAGGSFEIQTLSDTAATPADPGTDATYVGAAVGGDAQNRFELFVGPKDLSLLRNVNPKLGELVNFGKWFGFIAEPLFLALRWVNEKWVHNYGWAIVLVTVIINFLLLPLKFSSLKSMKKMQSLQPQIAAINEKYRNVGIRDPKKAEQNQEVMELYKKNGVNPMGGCMPMLLQVPFFIAFYTVLTVAIELRGANWLWVSDLSQPEQIPIRILPLAMIATQFLLQKMTPSTSIDPAQQRVMLLMPLLMGFMFYGVSSGLVLYWLTGNVVGIAQQWFFNKVTPAPAVVESKKPAPAAKKKASRT